MSGSRASGELRDAVICEPLRTAVGSFGGASATCPRVLAATVIGERAAHALAGPQIEDVILGQCYPNGEAPAIGRVAALDAGLRIEVPGVQLDRRCGSGLQAVISRACRFRRAPRSWCWRAASRA